MRVLYSNILISSGNLTAGRVGSGSSWNGQPVMDVVAFFRAAQATIFGRSDGPEEFTHRVQRFFDTEAEVLTFCATHRSTLPLQADLVLVDDDETVALKMADAVREVRIAQIIGRSVFIDYKWTGSGFATEDVPGDSSGITTDDTVKTGYVALAADDESKAIAFSIAFGAIPKFVDARVCSPTGGPVIDSAPINDTITAAGFTAKFAAAIPGSGYVLRWTAIL